MATQTDRIEKQITLRAPRSRVWRAISNAKEFGQWFGVAFDGDFVAGKRVTGKMVPTEVDPEVAAKQKPYAGKPWEAWVEVIEPERLFSFRWHPFATDSNVDYSKEPTTLVEFVLDEIDGGTRLTITESGFDALPIGRRAEAFTANDGGWTFVIGLVDKYLRHAS